MTGQGGIASFLPLILLGVAAWFLIVRPQQKRAKDQAEMLTRLEPGAEIVTIGGIFGTVVELTDERVRISVADGSELEIARQAVRSVVASAEEEDDETESDEDAVELDDAADEALPAAEDSEDED
jgi:preprotein translocase subunit YajC